jgi:transposase-like protein
MSERVTIASLSREITSEADAYAWLESLRWGDNPTCAHCGGSNVYLLVPKNGVSRRTRTGSLSERRVWQCRPCRKQFSVLTNTVMHGSKVSVRTWLMVIFEMCASKNGVSARELERKYGLCPRTAWYVAHRVREAMRSEGGLMSGSIVSDETWVGGDPKNRHKNERRVDGRHRHALNKTPVVSLICRETGEVRSKVVANVTGDSIYSAMKPNVSMRYSHLQTDEARGYSSVSWLFGQHTQVNHLRGQYVAVNGASTNAAENYFSQLKRSLDGTHHHVSREHLERYLAEFDFRYTTRRLSDPERMRLLVGQVAKRLTYKMTTTPAPAGPGPQTLPW